MKHKKGKTTLADAFPALLPEWDYEKNNKIGLQPDLVAIFSVKKAHWKCLHEHEWEATIGSRTQGAGCPYCSGRLPIVGKTDLATLMPHLLPEWDYEENAKINLTPKSVTSMSSKKAYWICLHGHKWMACISRRSRGAGCPYCAGKLPIAGETDLASLKPDLLAEWDYEENSKINLSPQSVTVKSDKKVHWKCLRGHEWTATIHNRAYGSGCPYCSGRFPIIGETDLAALRPDLLAEWDYEENNKINLFPQNVTDKSVKKACWKCLHGHKWKALIRNRANGSGCPHCRRMPPIVGETDLATLRPDLLAEWDYEKNDKIELFPQNVTDKSIIMAYWKCLRGHKWKALICNRANGSDCPHCRRLLSIVGKTDLATLKPDLLAEWDYEENDKINLFPQAVTLGSNKKAHWKCIFGHKWVTSINNRSYGYGCPYCAGKLPIAGETDLASLRPDLLSEWDYEENSKINLSPQSVTVKSNKKVHWKCLRGHEWTATICNRANGSGCPYCSGLLPIVGETDLATLRPDLLSEWDYEENSKINLSPQSVTVKSHKKVHWKCLRGHEWTATICNRANGSGCPYCNGRLPIVGETDLATIMPSILSEWDHENNSKLGLTPQSVSAMSHKKVYWICRLGHKWTARIEDRVCHGSGCPSCRRLDKSNPNRKLI